MSSVAGVATAGSTASIGGTAREFVYDETGRMTQAKSGGVIAATYAYNGKRERVRKIAGATTVAHGESAVDYPRADRQTRR